MLVLAIDTATTVCGVAVTEQRKLLADYRLNRQKVHSERLVSSIQNLMVDLGLDLDEIDGIALSIGPGSFTGLRIGMSAAKGLAFSLGVPVSGVNTLDALAYSARLWQGTITVISKVRSGEIYYAEYQSGGKKFQRTSECRIVPLTDLGALLDERTLLVSDNVDTTKQDLDDHITLAPSELTISQPLSVALLGTQKLTRGDVLDLDTAEPHYLKEFVPIQK